jgi:MFS family permease
MTSSEDTLQSAPTEGYPPASVAWYVVALLTLANLFAFLDRQIVALLIEPIKNDLNLTDTQISLLLGFAFAIFYSVLGIFVGRLADQHNRRAILGAGMAIWCLATAACGLARNFVTLFVARVGIGVGQSVLSPCALSLISDHFPRESRGRAVSIYSTGIGLGVGLAYILGGQLVRFVSEAEAFALPLIGELAPWQTVFLIAGLPGLVVAGLIMTVTEPTRKEKIGGMQGNGAADVIPIPQVIRYMGDRWQAFTSLFLGMAAVVIVGYVFLVWAPTMFVR